MRKKMVAKRKSKKNIVATMPSKMMWEPVNETVEIVGAGHFPDTVMAQYHNREIEISINDLRDLSHG